MGHAHRQFIGQVCLFFNFNKKANSLGNMARLLKKRHRKKGLPPGSLVGLEEGGKPVAFIEITNYNADLFETKRVSTIEECLGSALNPKTITWINLTGVASTQTMEDVGRHFGLHRLWLEDVLNTDHRPKIDEIEDLVFAVIKSASINPETHTPSPQVMFEQISLFLGPHFVISFEEHAGDTFQSVHKRIQTNKGKIRESGPDHLFYALIDSVVDDYFIVLENIGATIDRITQEIESSIESHLSQKLIHLKTDTIQLRRAVLPIRDSLSVLSKFPHPSIQASTLNYFKDAYEHTLQIVEVIDDYKEVLNDINQAHRTLTNERLNKVMKLLTIFTAIFAPLTFIVGVYGMNFHNMPELQSDYGYPITMVGMLAIAFGLFFYFKKQKWL